jgi:hypothetical protein
MSCLHVTIADDLDIKFRSAISNKFGGMHRGDLQRATTEAIELWIKDQG